MQQIFLNEAGLLRSGWRFAVFVFVFVFTGTIFRALAQELLSGMQIVVGTNRSLLLNAGLSLFPALLASWLCVRYLEKLPFRSIGMFFTRGWLKHLVFGIALGVITLGVAVSIAYVFGGMRFTLNHVGWPAILRSLLVSGTIFAVAAAFEEILFRGYILQTFSREGLAWLAILMTSAFFGAVHLGNPNAGLISTVNTVIAGVWFGLAYLKTRDLWFVWGLHFMWNWTQGSIFGIEVSGITTVTSDPLFIEIDHGPVWLTGETYGIEGGIACTAALTASIVFIFFYPGLKPDAEMLRLTSANPRQEPVLTI